MAVATVSSKGWVVIPADLRKKYGLDEPTLFDDDDEQMERALALQEAKIAYVDHELAASR